MTYTHTFTVGSVDLIFATVFFLHSDLLELVGDVIGGATVEILLRVNTVGAIRSRSNFVVVLGGVIIFLIAAPAVFCRVSELATDLIAGRVRARPVGAAATAGLGVRGAAVAGVGGANTVFFAS